MDTLELIELYHEGKLSAEEKSDFERRLGQEPELRKELKAYLDLIRGIRRAEEETFTEKVAEWEKEVASKPSYPFAKAEPQSHGAKVKPMRKGWQTYAMGIAAAVIVLIGVGWLLNRSGQSVEAQALYTEYYAPLPDYLSVRGVNEPSTLEATMILYRQKKYKAAEEGFGKLLEKEPNYMLLHLYQGICRMELGNSEEAAQSFDTVIKDMGRYQADAKWYAVLNLLKAGDTQGALASIDQQLSTGNTKYEERLLEIRKAIE
ncbi:MAG: tetratricopeptide repeat protein [Bacteroidota bacterium]